MFRKVFLLISLLCMPLYANDLKISGQTEYTQQQSKTLITSINAEYRVDIYKPDHKMWVVYLGGKINPEYDHFGKEVRANVFTTLGIDF